MQSKTQSAVSNITNKAQFDTLISEGQEPVLIDLWATWCRPCQQQLPILEEVAKQAGEKVRVAKVNVDECHEVAEALGVASIPTLIVYRNGQETNRFVGVQSAQTLLAALGC